MRASRLAVAIGTDPCREVTRPPRQPVVAKSRIDNRSHCTTNINEPLAKHWQAGRTTMQPGTNTPCLTARCLSFLIRCG